MPPLSLTLYAPIPPVPPCSYNPQLIAQDRKELLVFNGAIMENRSVVAAGAMVLAEHRQQRASFGNGNGPSNGSPSHK